MKFLSVKKINTLMYKISVDLEKMKYTKKFLIQKSASICVLGIPCYSTKYICVEPNNHDLRDVVS